MKKITKHILCAQILLLAFIGCDNPKNSVENIVSKDDYYDKCRKIVLSENKIGQEYFFKLTKKEIDEFTLTYLGNIKTKKGDTLKFLNAVNYFGNYEDTKHANGLVYIYNAQNKIIGNYYVGGALGIPTKIEGSNLIFSYDDENCNQKTAINFLDSIPKQIFINCTEKGGDLYSFTKE